MATLTVDTDLVVPASDGVGLGTDVIRPAGPGRHPAVVMRTAYDRTTPASVSLQVNALRLARAGYAVVLQDIRGRHGSGGTWEPFVNEQADGLATIEWIIGQTWSDGKVATAGISYNGFSQTAVAVTRHPALRAWVPALTPSDVRDSWIRLGGALNIGFHLAWALGNMVTLDHRTIDPVDLLADFDDVMTTGARGLDQPGLRDHPAARWIFAWADAEDPYPGDARVPRDDELGDGTAPALVVAGWYDIFAHGSFRLFKALGHRGHMVAGPWDHSGLPLGRGSGDMDFGRQAAVDLHQLQLDWYDVHLRETGVLPPRARIFVTGRNEWTDLDEWPPVGELRNWNLHGDGRLSPEPAASGEVVLGVNADDPSLAGGGRLHPWEPELVPGSFDRSRRDGRGDVVPFTSELLHQPLLVMGQAEVVLWTSSTATGQFVAELVDVHPDGSAWNVTDGVVEFPAGDREVVVDLGDIAHEFGAGHRIRLDVSGAAAPRYLVRPGQRIIGLGPTRLRLQEVG